MADEGPVYRVAVVVQIEASGADELDAEMGAAMAVRQLLRDRDSHEWRPLILHMRGGDVPMTVENVSGLSAAGLMVRLPLHKTPQLVRDAYRLIEQDGADRG